MNYGEVLQRAWKVIWKNKILWLFGFLASCGSGAGGGGGGGGGGGSYSPNNGSGLNPPPEMQQFFGQMKNFFENMPVWLPVLLVCGTLILVVAAFFLSSLGKTGLMRGAWLADEGRPKLSLSIVWGELKPYFWRVVLLNLLLAASGIVLGLLIALPIIAIALFTLGIGLICLIPLLCLLLPISLLINMWVEESMAALVGENLGVLDSLKRGYAVIRSNLTAVLVMGLILWIGGGLISLVIGLPALLILVPIFGGLIAGTFEAMRTGFIVSVVVLALYLPLAWLLGGVLQAYLSSAWVITFRRLTGREFGDAEAASRPDPVEPLMPEVVEPEG